MTEPNLELKPTDVLVKLLLSLGQNDDFKRLMGYPRPGALA